MHEDVRDRSLPIDVNVKNSADFVAKPKGVCRTTFQTYLLDASGAVGDKYVQICDYETNRRRVVVQVLDEPVVICTSIPSLSPDYAGVTDVVTGRYLPNSLDKETSFYGPDAFWINTVAGTVTRVTITKEYE